MLWALDLCAVKDDNMAKQGRYGSTAVVIAVLLYQVRARSTAGKAWRARRRQVTSPKARLAASPEDASRKREFFWGGWVCLCKMDFIFLCMNNIIH